MKKQSKKNEHENPESQITAKTVIIVTDRGGSVNVNKPADHDVCNQNSGKRHYPDSPEGWWKKLKKLGKAVKAIKNVLFQHIIS